jgi:hypothetical protein
MVASVWAIKPFTIVRVVLCLRNENQGENHEPGIVCTFHQVCSRRVVS